MCENAQPNKGLALNFQVCWSMAVSRIESRRQKRSGARNLHKKRKLFGLGTICIAQTMQAQGGLAGLAQGRANAGHAKRGAKGVNILCFVLCVLR